MAREIPLTKGKVALVDDAAYQWLGQMRWYAADGRYAARSDGGSGHIYMHRLVVGGVPKGLVVDHINGDTFDNRRANLRICTPAENKRNTRGFRADKFKGVFRDGNSWLARIIANGNRYHLGCFRTEIEAARAYDAAARRLHGEFARLNFPEAA